jgi:hypothetical protein
MAAGNTHIPIATYTVSGSSTASYTFSSIPSTYTDLVVIASVRSGTAANTTNFLCQVNGVTGNVYDGFVLRGTGSSATSARYNKFIDPTFAAPIGSMVANNATSGTFSNHIINWNNYSNTTTYKIFLARSNSANNTATAYTEAVANMYFATIAISSLTFFPEAGNFVDGSTISIYGIKAA